MGIELLGFIGYVLTIVIIKELDKNFIYLWELNERINERY